ncbi:MAG: hypothetical protein KKC03_13460 [Bacteroidetes bacterium]|nr:hypothetical protein [Bacteroidota bacterium]
MAHTPNNFVKKLLGTIPITVTIRRRPIHFMDVKDLYDAAGEAKAQARVNLKQYKALMAKAEKLDAAYRAQLERDAPSFQKGQVA